MRGCLITLLLCLTMSWASGQIKQFRFQQLNVNHGLSHNQVTCFYKDERGFLWIGTALGLNRFDGYTIKIFTSDSRDSTSLLSNFITRIFEAPFGQMAVLTSYGLNLYNPLTETFASNTDEFYKRLHIPPGNIRDIVKSDNDTYWILHSTGLIRYSEKTDESVIIQHNPKDSLSISSNPVTSLAVDPKNGTWIIHSNGVTERIIPHEKSYVVDFRNDFLNNKNHGIDFDYRLLVDQDGELWTYLLNDPQGIYHLNPKTKKVKHYTREAGDFRLSSNMVADMVQDGDGVIWIGTDHGGINLINKREFSIQHLYHEDEEEKSIAQNSITTMFKDRQGIIWTGTFKSGVSYFHKNIIRFPLFGHSPQDQHSLPFADVNRFAEDHKGNIWIGTNGGGLIYFDREKNQFTQYRNDPANPNSLSNDVIVSLCVDKNNILWVGTYMGGLNSFDGKKFIRFNHSSANVNSISDRNIWEILEDSKGRLWIGTIGGGLNLMDRRTNTFTHFKTGDVNSVSSNYISVLMEDRDGNIWVGTSGGIDVLMRESNRFIHYSNVNDDLKSLSDNNVLDIRQDSKDRIWVGTQSGLNLFDAQSKTFETFKTADGLPHNTILTILEGNTNDLWLGTPSGIANVLINIDADGKLTIKARNFDESDGLQGKQFNENSTYKTSRGELIFGGANGFNLFKPDQIGLNTNPPVVVLSDFQLFNKSVHAGEAIDGKVILDKAISETEEIVLPPKMNVFSIEFTALNFFHSEKNQYKYKLEGFNSEWIYTDSHSRKITYTNLDPGDYTFKVQAANNDGYWNEEVANLKITVLPPFWKTGPAFFLYFLLIIAGLLIARKMIQQREQLKYAIEEERREALRMHELDMMKIKFFTNVSHEFRTPLTLILTPLEKILKQINDAGLQGQLTLIHRNARRLLNLVNQLLDFRKLEVQEIKFSPSEGDIISFIRETVYSFSDISEKKDIKLSLNTSVSSLETLFDQDKLEKILFNLLSNAFKFTPEHGSVTVDVTSNYSDHQQWLVIKVADTGIGIPADKKGKIFERFFQSDLPASMVNQGSGIGLSITREFVKIHGGTITVQSEPAQGSCFIVRFPVKAVVQKEPVVSHIIPVDELNEVETSESNIENNSSRKPVLLLVEDNEDFRFYLKDNLKLEFEIAEARNGKEGLKQVLKYFPDLIVSDVMMPEMDGMELCKRIKSDQRTSHIPVILLTARIAEEQKLQGFETGADDYVTKPFNFEILLSRIRNLIAQREQFQKIFQKHLDVRASELKITPLDEKFIQNAIKCVEENISSPEFTVEDLSHHLGISRANLYKKVLSLTGKSPLEFIRTIRMQQAAQLLEKSQLTVAEIAYQVGFNNPKYFTRYFKEEFNMLPSVYASEKRKGND